MMFAITKSFIAKNKFTRLLTNKYFILSFILAIGVFLRFYHLTGKSLWYDEACSLNLAAYNWMDIFFSHNVITHIPRPFYFILLKLWVGLFGYTEIAVRSLSVIFGILSIILIYKLARILFGVSAGLISAFILSISPYNIYYSQQVRYYTLFLFLCLLSMVIFVKLIRNNNLSLRVMYILTNILILYTLPVGVYILVLQNILFLVFKNKIKQIRYWLNMQIIMCVVFASLLLLPFIYVNHSFNNYDDEKFTAGKPSFSSFIETFDTFSYGGSRQGHAGVGFEIESSRLKTPRLLTFLFCLIFILSLTYREKKSSQDVDVFNHRDKILLLWLWLFITLFGFYLFSILFWPIFSTRYFIAVAPAFYIVIGYSISKMRAIKPVLISAIVILSFFSLNILYHPGSSNDWRNVADYLKSHIRKNDVIVFAPIMQIIPFWYYYKYDQVGNFNNNIDNYGEKFYHRKNCNISYDSNTIIGFGLKEDRDYINKELLPLSNSKANIWLVMSPYWIGKNQSEFIKGLLKSGRSIKYSKYFEYDGVEAIYYSFD
ncbi:MAG: glycosyltransferase family 39 protein [Candidatus Omnitrophota bacterium]